jgi:hypothetical membrane protein
MILSGIFIIAASFCSHKAFRKKAVTSSLGLFGIGILGVGIFNGSYGDIHAIFALLAFVMGGLAAILSSRIVRTPFNYFSIILGSIALLNLFLFYIIGEASPFFVLGIGGLERWIAYPILLWVTGFGGYLLGHSRS